LHMHTLIWRLNRYCSSIYEMWVALYSALVSHIFRHSFKHIFCFQLFCVASEQICGRTLYRSNTHGFTLQCPGFFDWKCAVLVIYGVH
jgi:hypothetical protein